MGRLRRSGVFSSTVKSRSLPPACVICGGTAPKGNVNTPQVLAWNEEVAELLCLALVSTAIVEGDVKEKLATGDFCARCRQGTRDLAFAGKTAIKAIEQLVLLIPKIFDTKWHKRKLNGRKRSYPRIFYILGGNSWRTKSEPEVKMELARNLFSRGVGDGNGEVDVELDDRMDEGETSVYITGSLPDEDDASFNAEETWAFEGMDGLEEAEPEDTEELVEAPLAVDLMVEKCGNEVTADIAGEGSLLNVKEEPREYPENWESFEEDFVAPSGTVKKEEVSFQQSRSRLLSGEDCEDRRRSGRSTQRPEKFTPPASFKKPKPDPSIPRPPPKPAKVKSPPRFRPKRYRPARERAKIARYPFACTEDVESCTKRFASQLLLTCHVRQEHLKLPRPFKCPECPKETTKFSPYLVEHILSHHPGVAVISVQGRPFAPFKHQCSSCSRYFKEEAALGLHMGSHHNPRKEEMLKELPFECFVCEKRFKVQEELTGHFDRIHKDNPNPFSCEDCGSVFKNSVSLRFHMKNAHPTPDRVACGICKNRSFLSEAHLNLHTSHYHRKEPFKCPHCDFETTQKAVRERHKREVHEDIYAGSYKCEVEGCGKEFKWRNRFTTHMTLRHSGKKFECVVCGKVATTTVTLREHEATHAGVRNICHICGMSLITTSHLRRHLRNKHPEGTELVFPMTGRGPSKPKPNKWRKLPATVTSSEMSSVAESANVACSSNKTGEQEGSSLESEQAVMNMMQSLPENPVYENVVNVESQSCPKMDSIRENQNVETNASAQDAPTVPLISSFYPYQFIN